MYFYRSWLVQRRWWAIARAASPVPVPLSARSSSDGSEAPSLAVASSSFRCPACLQVCITSMRFAPWLVAPVVARAAHTTHRALAFLCRPFCHLALRVRRLCALTVACRQCVSTASRGSDPICAEVCRALWAGVMASDLQVLFSFRLTLVYCLLPLR